MRLMMQDGQLTKLRETTDYKIEKKEGNDQDTDSTTGK
jgi:hypothetical protein